MTATVEVLRMRIAIELLLLVSFTGCATASAELRLACQPVHASYAGGGKVPVRVTFENVSSRALGLSGLSLPWQRPHAITWRLAEGEWLTDPRLGTDSSAGPGTQPDTVLPSGGRTSGEIDLAAHLRDAAGRTISLFAGDHRIVGTGLAFVRDAAGKQAEHRLACGPFTVRIEEKITETRVAQLHAEHRAQQAGFDPATHRVVKIERIVDGPFRGTWHVFFERVPPTPGGRVTIYVNAATGAAGLVPER
jgi:hypothetical protein